VTGAAGFIGFHLCRRLLGDGYHVTGFDNLNDYYDVGLKQARLRDLQQWEGFQFYFGDLASEADLRAAFRAGQPDIVANLAAQAGVRYSLENPQAYVQSNLVGFANILEACRHSHVERLVYASSSSVYGANKKMPFSVKDNVDHPISLYAASKKANELMAHTYSHLYDLPTIGLRFFSVYGPWGRPDMALYIFTKAILEEKPIPVFNYGKMRRNFTYIDDVVEGIVRVMARPLAPDSSLQDAGIHPGTSHAPYKVYNIGNDQPVDLMQFIGLIEECVGKKARLDFQPLQPGDVPATFADVEDLKRDTGYQPSTPIEEGIARFVEWYRSYHAPAWNEDLRIAA
jgi:UDP-glucuronate 4-epimerase